MSHFAYKFARAFLLFYCLTPPQILTKCEDNQEKEITMMRREWADANEDMGIFAFVRRFKSDKFKTLNFEEVCGAAWIDSNFLLTAASCLDNGEFSITLEEKLEKKFDVQVQQMRKFEVSTGRIEYYRQLKNTTSYRGQALLHPLFQRFGTSLNGRPFAYDVALVKISGFTKDKKHVLGAPVKGNLCNLEVIRSDDSVEWSALYLWKRFSAEQLLVTPNFTQTNAVFEDSEVTIDSTNQFIAKIKDVDLNEHDLYRGGPIIHTVKSPERKSCIAGVMLYKGNQGDFGYITSTRVSIKLVHDWIEHAKANFENPQKKVKGLFRLDKLQKLENVLSGVKSLKEVLCTRISNCIKRHSRKFQQ